MFSLPTNFAFETRNPKVNSELHPSFSIPVTFSGRSTPPSSKSYNPNSTLSSHEVNFLPSQVPSPNHYVKNSPKNIPNPVTTTQIHPNSDIINRCTSTSNTHLQSRVKENEILEQIFVKSKSNHQPSPRQPPLLGYPPFRHHHNPRRSYLGSKNRFTTHRPPFKPQPKRHVKFEKPDLVCHDITSGVQSSSIMKHSNNVISFPSPILLPVPIRIINHLALWKPIENNQIHPFNHHRWNPDVLDLETTNREGSCSSSGLFQGVKRSREEGVFIFALQISSFKRHYGSCSEFGFVELFKQKYKKDLSQLHISSSFIMGRKRVNPVFVQDVDPPSKKLCISEIKKIKLRIRLPLCHSPWSMTLTCTISPSEDSCSIGWSRQRIALNSEHENFNRKELDMKNELEPSKEIVFDNVVMVHQLSHGDDLDQARRSQVVLKHDLSTCELSNNFDNLLSLRYSLIKECSIFAKKILSNFLFSTKKIWVIVPQHP
ncbi:hypothetical protein LIER_04539 [Lithospermum erythrorhizon]|uniref:Uncharacterized protein n=1 Tax=Lithospermum erythrorhizon TaxID=34254 RepID=A0AAV3NXC3_LITER